MGKVQKPSNSKKKGYVLFFLTLVMNHKIWLKVTYAALFLILSLVFSELI
jgi:hypothetical protein